MRTTSKKQLAAPSATSPGAPLLKERFTVHSHGKEQVVFDNKERLAVLNYRTWGSANNAARLSNGANRVIETPYS